MPWSRCDAAIAVPSDCGHRRATASHRSAAPAGMRNQVLPQHVARRQPVRGVACGVGEARPPGNGRVHELITAYAPPAFQRTSHRPPRVVNCRHELDSIRARQGWLGEVVQGRGAGRLASRGLRELTYAGLGIPAGPRTGRGVPPAACRRGPARRARGDDSVPARVRAAARAPGCHRGRGGPGRPARSCRKHDDGSCHHRVGVARDLPGAGLPAPSQHRGRRPPGPGGWRRGGHLVNSRRPRRPPRLLSSVPQPPTESYESHPLSIGGFRRSTVASRLSVLTVAASDGGCGCNLTGASAVLAVLCLEEALAQVTRKGDDVDADEVVLECARCPGPCAGQERRCGQRVAQAQDELWLRVDGGGYPGQLEGIGLDLVLLRALWRAPGVPSTRPGPSGSRRRRQLGRVPPTGR